MQKSFVSLLFPAVKIHPWENFSRRGTAISLLPFLFTVKFKLSGIKILENREREGGAAAAANVWQTDAAGRTEVWKNIFFGGRGLDARWKEEEDVYI